ncbi:MAG: hypothetical protein WBO12_18330 [Xanthobacteraceae bacterium]
MAGAAKVSIWIDTASRNGKFNTVRRSARRLVQQGDDLAVNDDKISHPTTVRRMFGFSLDWWNGALLFSLAVTALAAIAGGVATAVVMKLQKQVTIDTAKRIEDANARAAEAELKLAEFRKPRGPIIQEHAKEFVDGIKPFAGTKFDMGHAPVGREQWDFAWQLEPLMSQAGWVFVDWTSATGRFSKVNWTMNPHRYGVANVENVSIELAPESREQLMPAATGLANAFKQIGIDATVTLKNNGSTNVGVIDLLLGTRS